jgi:hypothetical protein
MTRVSLITKVTSRKSTVAQSIASSSVWACHEAVDRGGEGGRVARMALASMMARERLPAAIISVCCSWGSTNLAVRALLLAFRR